MSVPFSGLPDHTALPVTLRVGCKVNLHLFLTGVREDGWHELDSLFLPLAAPCDVITLTERPNARTKRPERPELVVTCSTLGIDPKCNTLTQAYTAFYVATGFAPPIHAQLKKGIPHGAGLGGGSADAATLLRWLNTAAATCGKALSEADLHALATGVGADVPFFLRTEPCRAVGIGDKLTPCHPVICDMPLWLVLICPPDGVATPWAYRALDTAVASGSQQTFLTVREAQAISLVSVCTEHPGTVLVNDFEPVVCAWHPRIRVCKELLFRTGALAAVMSGSGASLMGLFRNEAMAREAALACEKLFHGTQAWVSSLRDQNIDGV